MSLRLARAPLVFLIVVSSSYCAFAQSHYSKKGPYHPDIVEPLKFGHSDPNTSVPKSSVLRLKPRWKQRYTVWGSCVDDYFGVTTQKELDEFKALTGKNRQKFRTALAKEIKSARDECATNTFIANQLTFTEDFWKAASPQMSFQLRHRNSTDVSGNCWRQKLLMMCLLSGLNAPEIGLSQTDDKILLENYYVIERLLKTLEDRNKPLSDKEIAKAFESVMDLDGKAQ